MHKVEVVRFIDDHKYFWSPEAINYSVTYINYWTKKYFQLEVSEYKVVIPPLPLPTPSKFTDPLKYIRGPSRSPWPPLKTAGLDRRWGPPSVLFSGNYIGHSRPFNVEFKNEWRCTSTPHIYGHGVDGENITFV